MPTDGRKRSSVRDISGPRAVDADTRDSSRRNQREATADERDPRRSKRVPDKASPKIESSHRRRSSNTQSTAKQAPRPSFELEVIGQPPKAVPYGMDVEASVMVSLRYPPTDRVPSTSSIDTSRLFAVASLVEDLSTGERVPVESGSLTGQKLFDSVHTLPEQWRANMRSQPYCLSLGYFTFSGLLIRQPGNFRIRTTLIQMAAPGSSTQGGTTVMAIDSEPLRVERRASNLQRPLMRVYA